MAQAVGTTSIKHTETMPIIEDPLGGTQGETGVSQVVVESKSGTMIKNQPYSTINIEDVRIRIQTGSIFRRALRAPMDRLTISSGASRNEELSASGSLREESNVKKRDVLGHEGAEFTGNSTRSFAPTNSGLTGSGTAKIAEKWLSFRFKVVTSQASSQRGDSLH